MQAAPSAEPELHIPEINLGVRMLLARKSAGLEQTELEERIGVSRRSIQNYERGRTRPSRPVLLSWALATGVPLAWLTEGEIPHVCPNCGEPSNVTKNRCSSTFALVRSPGRRASDVAPELGEHYADVYRLPLPPV